MFGDLKCTEITLHTVQCDTENPSILAISSYLIVPTISFDLHFTVLTPKKEDWILHKEEFLSAYSCSLQMDQNHPQPPEQVWTGAVPGQRYLPATYPVDLYVKKLVESDLAYKTINIFLEIQADLKPFGFHRVFSELVFTSQYFPQYKFSVVWFPRPGHGTNEAGKVLRVRTRHWHFTQLCLSCKKCFGLLANSITIDPLQGVYSFSEYGTKQFLD